uniref:Helicase ARIP4 n=1 Tax=Lygus hesperus TaxID=30085 RepID=A0A0A9XT94_LYGHE
MARKKTFTLIAEVRHFVQRMDSTPLRQELPPLHEYIIVVPLSQHQKELYMKFLHIIQRHGGEGFQFLPAVSMAGKIAAHPQLVYKYSNHYHRRNNGSKNSNGVHGSHSKDMADPSSPLDEDEDEATQLSHLSFSALPRFI